MTIEDLIRMAADAGIMPWTKHEWLEDKKSFVYSDEGLDGDLACLMQFAALVVAAEREACAKACEQAGSEGYGTLAAAAMIRARGKK